jgi:hypothetical protein
VPTIELSVLPELSAPVPPVAAPPDVAELPFAGSALLVEGSWAKAVAAQSREAKAVAVRRYRIDVSSTVWMKR